ncbi:MAG: HAD-IIB family hydrolase [Candidatus Aminicenantia bacterium]
MLVVFSDLDGTLFNREYSFKKATPALQILKEKRIPLVLCSSKTETEMIPLRKELSNTDPFIVENGGAIFIPEDYFKLKFDYSWRKGRYKVIEIGRRNSRLEEILSKIGEELEIKVKTFSTMTTEEIASLTGLNKKEIKSAKKREYSEPFIIQGSSKEINQIERRIKKMNLLFTQGESFYYIMTSNKGIAALKLMNLYKDEFKEKIIFIGIGDNYNDLPLLSVVDIPVLVKKPSGNYESRIKLPNLIRAKGVGPEGWRESIISLLSELEEETKWEISFKME